MVPPNGLQVHTCLRGRKCHARGSLLVSTSCAARTSSCYVTQHSTLNAPTIAYTEPVITMKVPALIAGKTLAAGAWLFALLIAPAAADKVTPLYMPRAVKQAFKNGTRSSDGRPGAKYWQNRARYAITLTALPPDRTVRGTEQLTYANNSPDTLSSLVIRLYLNIHRPGAPRDAGANDAYLTSGTHIDAFAINGTATPWKEDPAPSTWQRVALAAPLLPHDSIRLGFDWHYDAAARA